MYAEAELMSAQLNPIHQFDQAGVVLRVDSEHWVKAGIEVRFMLIQR